MGDSDPYRRGKKKDTDLFRITLVCGHIIRARNQPFRPDTTYGCTLGLGCGYSLGWVSWESGDASRDNIKLGVDNDEKMV